MNAMTNTAEAPAPTSAAPEPIIFEAIVRKLCVTAIYNRTIVTLAPHIIYTRHDDLFVDALTVDRDGKPPKEQKIGTYKLAGLGALSVTQRSFRSSSLFSPGDPKYDGVTLMSVEAT